MEAKSKKCLVGTLFVLLVVLSSSTAVQAIHGSQITTLFSERFEWIFPQNDDTRITDLGTDFNDTEEQLFAIFEFMKKNFDKKRYELSMRSLGRLQEKYLKSEKTSLGPLDFDVDSFMSILESQDEDVKDQAKDKIKKIYLATSSGNRNNTPDFYRFRSLYLLGSAMTFNLNFWDWARTVAPILIIIDFILVLVATSFSATGAMEPAQAILMAFGSTFVILGFILTRYGIAWLLSTSSADMVFNIVNATGVPLDGLELKAIPWDRDIVGPLGFTWISFPEWEFEAVQPNYSCCHGLYLIPADHVGDIDVPPGIYNFRVLGDGSDGNYYDTYFNNSEDPIPSYGRYAHFITLYPSSPP